MNRQHAASEDSPPKRGWTADDSHWDPTHRYRDGPAPKIHNQNNETGLFGFRAGSFASHVVHREDWPSQTHKKYFCLPIEPPY